MRNITLKPNQHRVRLVKTSDNRFSGQHPNGILEGSIREGICDRLPEIGQSFWLTRSGSSFATSKVIAVRETEFDTQNSTYEYKILERGSN